MKTLVISAVNLIEGGTLSVLRACVAAAPDALPGWRIVVLAHDLSLIDEPRVEVLAFPRAKTSWLRRIVLEWWGFDSLSRELHADVWLSLHDITPRVGNISQAVYCHNPSIFHRISWRDAFFEPKFLAFNLFYGYLYRAFIRRNSHVIVQQDWLRDEFRRRFGDLPLVVAHPAADTPRTTGMLRAARPMIFFFPALSRVFKNFEVLCRATELLSARGFGGFEARLTLDGTENRYARWLKTRFGAVPALRFIGRQSPSQMQRQYEEASVLVFPSRLETWGLPISEAKSHGLPLLVADAPYARETVGTYDLVSFFSASNAEALALHMEALLAGTWQPTGNVGATPVAPFAPDWRQLLHLLTADTRHGSGAIAAQDTH